MMTAAALHLMYEEAVVLWGGRWAEIFNVVENPFRKEK